MAIALSAPLFATSQSDATTESSDSRDDVIVVTAQFREQISAEVPISVTSYDQQFLSDVGITELDELSAFVPGLQIQEQSVNNAGFVIRGITSDSGSAVIEPRVSVFQNGVSISRSRGSYVPLFDLERVEVMKGPQGTLFGRSAQIGAVHMITAKPSDQLEGSIGLQLGNLSQRQFDAVINVPMSQSAFRLAATYRYQDGAIENTLDPDAPLNGTDTRALRASWRSQLTDALRFDLISTYVENDAPGTSFKSGIVPALNGNTSPFTPASLNPFGGLLDGRELGVKRDVFDLTAILDWQLSPTLNLNSTSAYREFNSFEAFDPDGTAFELFFFGEDAQGDQFSTELRLTWEPNDRLTAFFGGGYFAEQGQQRVPLGLNGSAVGALFQSLAATGPIENGQAILFGSPLIAQAFLSGDPAQLNQVLGLIGLPPALYQQEQFTNFSDNRSFDLFGDVSYRLTDRLTTTAGLRYTRDRKETLFSSGVEINNPFLGNLLVPDIDTPVSSNDDPTVDSRFDGWAWRLNANYEISDGQFAYANYARGRRPQVIADIAGEFNPALGVPVSFEVVPEERVDSYEIGFKTLFNGGRSQFDIAAFYYDYENFQTTISVDAGPGIPPDLQVINAGSATARGIETQLRSRLTDNLEVFANYAFNKGRFDDTDGDGNPLIFGGNRFRLSPDHTASLALRWSGQFNGGEWFVVPSVTWQSKIFFEDDNQREYAVINPADGTVVFTVPSISESSYALLNVRAGYQFAASGFSIEAFGRNLMNKEFIIDAGNTGAIFNIPTFIAGQPRTVGVGLHYRF
jgi:outer membrane receptor protein involved in Fe transport